MSAPICVAKGVDAIALKIRRSPPRTTFLSWRTCRWRALHATVEIDSEIPVEHYHAVAEVIGYMMRLKRQVSGLGY